MKINANCKILRVTVCGVRAYHTHVVINCLLWFTWICRC